MNEQAIQDAYGLFTGTGYTGSYDEFVDLIYTNQQALEDAYGLFQQTGYEGGLDGFSTLMGVKKKDDTSVSESPQETASTESTSGSAPQGATGAGASGSSLNYGEPELSGGDVAQLRQAAAMFPGARPLTTGQMATIQDVLSDVQEEQADKPTFEELKATRDEAVFTPEGMDFLKRAEEGEDVQKQAEDMAMVLHPAARREFFSKLYRNMGYDETQVEQRIAVADEFATEQFGSERMQAYAKYGFTPGQMVDPQPLSLLDAKIADGRGGTFKNTMSEEETFRVSQGLPEGFDETQFSTLSERQEFLEKVGSGPALRSGAETALDEADKRLIADLEVAGDYKTYSLFEQIAQGNYAETFGALSDETEKEIREIANGSTYFYETERTLEFKQKRAQRAQDIFDMAFDEEGELRTDEQVADDVMSRLSTWYETGDKTKLGVAEETLADLYKKIEEDPVNILRWPQSQVWRDNIKNEFKAMPQQIAEAKPKIAAVEDDVVDILVPATNRELTEDEFNALRDAKERFTQALPESYRPRVEDMDMNEFVQMVLHNKLERDKASAAIGFFDLTPDEIEAMKGRRIGALEGVKEYKAGKIVDEMLESRGMGDLGSSWAWDRLSNSWENAYQGSSAGWKHATLKKEGILIFEERDAELVKLMDELVSGKREPTTEDYYRIGSAKVDRSTYAGRKMRGEMDNFERPVYYANDEDLNFERSVVGLYLTREVKGTYSTLNKNADAQRRYRITLGKQVMERLTKDDVEEMREGLRERKKDREEAAYEYNFTQGKRNTITELLDREVMSKEDAKKGVTEHAWNGDWEQSMYKTWGLISDVSVDVTKALVTTTVVMAMTRNPQLAANVTAATFGYQAGGTTAGEYAAIPGITGDEAMGVAYKSAAIEFAVTRAFSGLELDFAKGVLGPRVGGELTEGVAKNAWQRFSQTSAGQMSRRMVGEGFEELFIMAGDQINRGFNEVKQGRMTPTEAREKYANGFQLSDAALGGFLGGGLGASPMILARGASAIGSKFTMFDRIKLQTQYEALAREFNDKKTTPERKSEIRAEMTKIAEDANRLHRKDAEFYASMSEADQSELIRLNQEISRVRKVAREPGKSEEQLKVLADEARGYMEAKLNIENQYDAAAAGFDLNPARQQQNQAEMDRIADDILGVDREFDALGLGLPGVQYKAGKMVLTREGVEGMLSRFLAGDIKGTKFATAEQIRDGMVNAFNMAKAIVDENPDAEVVMVNSREAWNREIGSPTKISRGVHVSEDGGKIVLYAPALKANTAYHEGFHQMVYRALDDGDGSALIKLASAVRRGMPRQMLEYYGRFLNQEAYQNKSEAEVAEEFLAEVYSDLTMGAIQVEYQKGIISGFVKFLNDALTSKGINIKASPTVVDLMSAIEDAAALMARGEGGGGKIISEAIQSAKDYKPGFTTREGRTTLRELRNARRQAAQSAAATESVKETNVRAQAMDPESIKPVKHNSRNRGEVARRIEEFYDDAIRAHREAGTGVDLQVSRVSRQQAEIMLERGDKFLVGDGVIAYVDSDGYAGGLIKNPNAQASGVIAAVSKKWLENGATHLEAYATFLEKAYMDQGFVPVARIKFDENIAPKGWDAENSSLKSKPDLVTFAYDPVAAALAKPGDGKYMSEYGDALNAARQRGERNPNIKEQATEFDEGDARAIKENDGEAIGSFYELLASKAKGAQGAVYRYRGIFEGFSQGRMIYADEQIAKTPEGYADRFIEFVFRPTERDANTIKLDEWFVTKPMDAEGKLIKGADNRGSGLGTRFLTMAMEVADEVGVDVELYAYPTRNYQGTELQNERAAKKLRAYYEKFGFVPISQNSNTMVRKAQANLAQLDSQEEQDTQDMGGKVKAQGIEATIQFDTKSVDGRRRYWTVRRKFTDEKHVKNFINYIEKKKGYTFDERWNHEAPPKTDPDVIQRDRIKKQDIAIDMISQDVPSDMTRSIQVARVMNTWAGSKVAVNEDAMVDRFLTNVYQEAGFYMMTKDADQSGITWYKEDVESAKKKLAVIYPELNTEEMQSVAMALLAILSPGNSPNSNMVTLAALLNTTPTAEASKGNFARNWGGDKMSFVTKKGKSLVSGRIVKETKTHYYVQGVDALGRDSKYQNGKNFLVKIAKSDMKPGYPKPTGFTQRGKVVATQLDKLEALFKDFTTPKAVVEFLKGDQPIATLRKYNPRVPDSAGKVNKNPVPGRRKGAYIFGEKVGSFFLNLEGMGESLTADLWFNRTWNRYMGTMIEGAVGSETIVETPRSEAERKIMARAVTEAAQELGLETSEMQAVMWYFEQELWRAMGMNTRSENYNTAIDEVASRLDLDDSTRQRLSEAGVNLEAAEARKSLAQARADAKGVRPFVRPQRPGTKVKAQPITSVTDPDGARFTDFKGVWGAIANAGILMHGTPANFAKFDNDLAFGPNVPGLYGNGTYLTRNVDKAAMYGKNVIFIDGQGLNLANMYSFKQGARITTALNKLNELGPQSYEVHKKIAMDARRGMAQRPNSPLGFKSEVGKNPEMLVERIIAETVSQMQDTNNQLGSGRTTIETLRNVMYGDNGKQGVAVKAMIDFQREVNRLRYESMDPSEAQLTALADGLSSRDAIDDAMAIARYTFAEIVRQAGFDGYYFSAEMDRGYQGIERRAKEGKLETREQQEMKLEALEIAGTDGGFAQEAVIVNTDRLNELIIPAENVIAAAVSRITAEESTIDQGGQMGNNGNINDGMRDSQKLLKAQGIEEWVDNHYNENAEFESDAPTVRVKNLEELGTMARVKLDILEFFQDKFAKVIYVQRQIEKGRGKRVFREQDYDMALALFDGKAAARLRQVDAFMEDLAKMMRLYGIDPQDVSDFLYAMHAPDRNRVIGARRAAELSEIADSIAEINEELNDSETTAREKRQLNRKKDRLQEDYDSLERRMADGNWSGQTDQWAKDTVEALDSENMRKIYNKVMEFQAETRRLIVEYGLESQETIDLLEATYSTYVPLSGFAVDEAGEAGYLNMHQARVFRGIRRADGRKSVARNPLENIFHQRHITVMAGEKNSANTRLLNLLASNPQPDLYKIYGPKDKAPRTKAEMRAQDSPYLEVVVNGESFFIEFANASMARAVNKHNVMRLGGNVHEYVQRAFQFIRNFGRFMSQTFTSYSPDFIGANFTRDIQTGVMSLLAEQSIPGGQAYGQRIAVNAIKGVKPAIGFLGQTIVGQVDTSNNPLSKYWSEFNEFGAVTAWPYQKDAEQYASDIESLIKMQEKGISGKKAMAVLERYVGGVNQVMENATRFSVFVAARKAGVDAEQAAYLAKELTVNFNRSGSGGSFINAFYLFFNAGVQGTSKFGRTMLTLEKVPDGRGGYYKRLNPAQKIAAGISMFAYFQAMFNQGFGPEDDDGRTFYEKIPDYVLERNMVIVNPFARKPKGRKATWEDYYIKIPLPYGYNIFHNMGTMTHAVTAGYREPGDAAMFMTSGFLNSFIPVSFGESSSLDKAAWKAITPTFARPMAEVVINENYYGGKVYMDPFPGQAASQSSMARRGPQWWRDIFAFINKATGGNEYESGPFDINPDKLWHIGAYWTGGAGKFIERSYKTGAAASGYDPFDLVPENYELQPGDVPIVRIFLGGHNEYQDMAEYYEFRDDIRAKTKAVKELPGKSEEEGYENVMMLNANGNVIDKKLSQIRKDLKWAEENLKDDRIKQARIINELEEEQRLLILEYNKNYLKYVKERTDLD